MSFDFNRANTLSQPGRYFLKVIDGGAGQYAPGSYTIRATWEAPANKRCDQVCPPAAPTTCSGLILRAIDFNDPSFRAAPSDPAVLQAGGREVEGAAADGVTPVLLVAEGLSGPGAVTFSTLDECSSLQSSAVGSLHDPITGLAGTPLIVQATQVAGTSTWKAYAVWTTPLDFSRGSRDDGAAYRTVRCEVTATGSCGRKSLLLVRPPVVMVHGLWGAGTAWDFRSMPFRNAARYLINGRTMPEYVYRHDYRLTNGDHLLDNITPLRRGIDSSLRSFRGLDSPSAVPLACTQVDLLGHSMGCVVSRLFIANVSGEYLRADNFLRGDVHKFVAIAGPHFGSPWADVFDALLRVQGLGGAFARLFESFDKCLDCGAVHDLQLDLLDSIPAARVPSHAIYGTGASDYIGSGAVVPPRIFDDGVASIVSWLAAIRRTTLFDFSTLLFGSERSDMLVGEDSARSGLPDSKVSEFSLVDGVHTYMHKSWRVEARVEQLLNARLSDPAGPFAPVLPGGPNSLPLRAGSPTPTGGRAEIGVPYFGVLEGALRIASPMSLTGLKPGDAISVEVFPITGFVPDGVVILGGAGGVEVLQKAPFRTVVEIPSVADVSHTLVALGWTDHSLAISGQLLLRLDGSTVPESLVVSPDPLFLLPYEPCVQLAVQARYADLSLRPVRPNDPGLSFQSSASAIATVDLEGRVCARGNGRASIGVTYNGRSLEVPVIVDLTQADDHRALASRRQCGQNPGGFDVSGSTGGRPVTGATVALHLDPASLGYGTGLLLGYEESGSLALSRGQMLCIDLSSPRLFAIPVTATTTSQTFRIPNSPGLVGYTFTAQALLSNPIGPGAPATQFANAWDFRVGTF
jgi:pimeloyl-ACP methyl ester carboxylesterase